MIISFLASTNENIGICHPEVVNVVLDCSQGSGLVIGAKTACNKGYIILQVIPNSVADKSGCIQKGDRILSVNKLYNLDASVLRQILGDFNQHNTSAVYQGTHWVEVELEYDLSDSVIPASGVFNVKVAKVNSNGLGITVNATNSGTFVISEVKMGSPAHRTGSLRVGDILLAVDSQSLQHFNIDSLLQENKHDFTTLTIKRNSLPDFLFDAQQRYNTSFYHNLPANNDYIYGYKTKENTAAARNGEEWDHQDIYNSNNSRQSSQDTQLRRPLFSHANREKTLRRPDTHDTIQRMTKIDDASNYNKMLQDDSDYYQKYKR